MHASMHVACITEFGMQYIVHAHIDMCIPSQVMQLIIAILLSTGCSCFEET